MTDPTQTIIRFYRALDEREYQVLADLLAPEGVWHRQGEHLHNEAEICAAMAKRSPTMRIHHLLTNAFSTAHGEHEAEVTAYLLVVRHDPGTLQEGPSPLRGVESIRTIRSRVRQTPKGWRIVYLSGEPPTFAA